MYLQQLPPPALGQRLRATGALYHHMWRSNRVRLPLRTKRYQQRRLSTAAPATMRAVRVFEPGPAETALNLSDQVSVPEVKPGEVLVRNEFSGVNFHDTYTRSGLCAHSHCAQRLRRRYASIVPSLMPGGRLA